MKDHNCRECDDPIGLWGFEEDGFKRWHYIGYVVMSDGTSVCNKCYKELSNA